MFEEKGRRRREKKKKLWTLLLEASRATREKAVKKRIHVHKTVSRIPKKEDGLSALA